MQIAKPSQQSSWLSSRPYNQINQSVTYLTHDTPLYQSPGWGNDGLGWGDEPWDDPQRLALKFLLKFPRIAELAYGYDFEYAAWYREALHKTPQGKAFALWWDGEEPSGHILIEHSGDDRQIPFPPGWPRRI